MKRCIVPVMVLILSAGLYAQTRPGLQKFEQLATQLQLTPQQKNQLIPILKAEAPKVQAIKADTSLSKLQKMEQLKSVHDETDPQVRSILTPQQYQKIQEIRRTEIREIMRNRH